MRYYNRDQGQPRRGADCPERKKKEVTSMAENTNPAQVPALTPKTGAKFVLGTKANLAGLMDAGKIVAYREITSNTLYGAMFSAGAAQHPDELLRTHGLAIYDEMLNDESFALESVEAYREKLGSPDTGAAWKRWPCMSRRLGVGLELDQPAA